MPRFSDVLFYLGLLALCSASESILELDDSFIEKKGEDPWLVMFYAPWCGHCRRMEPVWHQVQSAMKQSEIRIAKIDATKYPSIASEYGVNGYPTVKFIQGERTITYKGERIRDSVMEFAKRATGPVIRWLSNTGKFNDARSDHSSGVFFLYLGPDDDDEFLNLYKEVAKQYRVYSYFYAGTRFILPVDYEASYERTLLVFKDGKHYELKVSKDKPVTKEAIEYFVNGERFLTFPKLSPGGLNEMATLNKKIIIFVTQIKLHEDPREERFKQLGKTIATQFRDKYHKYFQFIWMQEAETVHTIMMARPETPLVIALEPESHQYYLPDQGYDVDKMTIEDMHTFLDKLRKGKLTARGGTGFGQRVQRLFYDIGVTVYGIYNESPWLALMVFGVPTLVISVVCYALCCMEPMDEDAFYEELAEEARAAQAEKEGLTDAEGQDVLTDDRLPRKRNIKSAEDEDESHQKKE